MWTEEWLKKARVRLKVQVYEGARYYGISSRTRRPSSSKKIGHIMKLPCKVHLDLRTENSVPEEVDFALDREKIRSLAFQFAEKLGLNHGFKKEYGMAGYDRLEFLITTKSRTEYNTESKNILSKWVIFLVRSSWRTFKEIYEMYKYEQNTLPAE